MIKAFEHHSASKIPKQRGSQKRIKTRVRS